MSTYSLYKKIFVFITIVLCIVILGVTLGTSRVHAVWGIGDLPIDTPNLGVNAATTASSGATTGFAAEDMVKELGLDTAAYAVAQQLAELMVNKFTSWVNDGFEGNPFYIPDQKSFMRELEDVQIVNMFSVVGGHGFGSNDQNAILSILDNKKKSLAEKLQPTISSGHRKAFMRDFSKGGWSTWGELGKAQNNPIGRNKIIMQDYAKKVAESKKIAAQEAAQNDGYFSKKKCVAKREEPSTNDTFVGPPEYSGAYEDDDEEWEMPEIEYSGAYEDPDDEEGTSEWTAEDQAEFDSEWYGTEGWDDVDDEEEEYEIDWDNEEDIDLSEFGYQVEESNFTFSPDCERWETQTPGSLVSNSINRASNQQFENLTMVDELSEIASAALGSMVDALINKGLSELQSATTNALSGAGSSGISYLGTEFDQNTNPDGSIDWLNAPAESVDLEVELPAAIKSTGITLSMMEKMYALEQKRLPLIQDMDYLMPGPDVGWEERLHKLWNDATADARIDVAGDNDSEEQQREAKRLKELTRAFGNAIKKEYEWIQDPRYQVFGIIEHDSITNYINNIEEYGRDFINLKKDLLEMRNTQARLIALKAEIMGPATDFPNFYAPGNYNETNGLWENDTWITPKQWQTWKNEGVVDGLPVLDSNGQPIDAVKKRELLRQKFLGMKQSIPSSGIVNRTRNNLTKTELEIDEMRELLTYQEQFWADNYRLNSNNKEDFAYWKSFYSYFIPYTTDVNQSSPPSFIPLPNLGLQSGFVSSSFDSSISRPAKKTKLGQYFRVVRAPSIDPNRSGEPGGPWGHGQPKNFPDNWQDLPQHQFQPTSSLSQYINTPLGIAGKLRTLEKSNFDIPDDRPKPPIVARFSGAKVRAYSIRAVDGGITEPWNILRRDREQRLFCGFYRWPEDILSDNGDHSLAESYDAIFCSDGWYRAGAYEYEIMYNPELAAIMKTL